MTRESSSTAGTMLFVLFGPILWALHLLVVYGGHASLCAFEAQRVFGIPMLTLLLALGTLGPLALVMGGMLLPQPLQAMLRAGQGDEGRWISRLMRLLAGLSAIAISYSGLTIVMVPYCLQLR